MSLELINGLKRRKEGLLYRVGTVGFAAEKTAGCRQQLTAEAVHELFATGRIPVPHGRDQTCLFAVVADAACRFIRGLNSHDWRQSNDLLVV